jgi:hypothetical protein
MLVNIKKLRLLWTTRIILTKTIIRLKEALLLCLMKKWKKSLAKGVTPLQKKQDTKAWLKEAAKVVLHLQREQATKVCLSEVPKGVIPLQKEQVMRVWLKEAEKAAMLQVKVSKGKHRKTSNIFDLKT